jgi:hypothetical protein
MVEGAMSMSSCFLDADPLYSPRGFTTSQSGIFLPSESDQPFRLLIEPKKFIDKPPFILRHRSCDTHDLYLHASETSSFRC